MSSERDRLVSEHLSLVQAIAGKLKRTLGKSIDFDDLVGYGHKGLIEAADRFDSKQGVTFTTFAYYRIRGAMLDGLRTMGWYSRSDYARYRAEERAHELMRNSADREAGAKESGAETEGDKAQTLESIAEILSNIATVHITSIEAASRVADERLPGPEADLETGQMGVRIREAVARAAREGAPAHGALLLRGEEPGGGGRGAGSIQVLGQPPARPGGGAAPGRPGRRHMKKIKRRGAGRIR